LSIRAAPHTLYLRNRLKLCLLLASQRLPDAFMVTDKHPHGPGKLRNYINNLQRCVVLQRNLCSLLNIRMGFQPGVYCNQNLVKAFHRKFLEKI